MVTDPYRELFVWAVLFGRMKLAMIFWKDCPEQIGSALVASLMFKKLAREAKYAGYHSLADKLILNVELVIIFCNCLVHMKLNSMLNWIWVTCELKSNLQCSHVLYFNETSFVDFTVLVKTFGRVCLSICSDVG